MLLELNDGKQYSAHFSHQHDVYGQWLTSCVFHEGKCAVKDCAHNPDGNFRGGGLARCNPIDQFSKVKGRIVSLTRALNTFGPTLNNRSLRSEIWAAYFKISRHA